MNDSKIMNKLDIGGQVKHVSQEDLEKNIDAFAQQFGNDKVYVTNSEGTVGRIPLSQLKDALTDGYSLYDDTQGYLSREDIKQASSQQQAQQQAQQKEKVERPTVFDGGWKGSIPQVAHSLLKPEVQQAMDNSLMAVAQTPIIPGQSQLEYTEKVTAIADKIQQQNQQKQQELERQMALVQTTQQINQRIDQINNELRQYEEDEPTYAVKGEMVPNMRTLFNPNRKKLTPEQTAKKSDLEKERSALELQSRFLSKIKEYQEYDNGGDYTKLGKLFRGMAVNGDLQSFAAMGLDRMHSDAEFRHILDKAQKMTQQREAKRKAGDLTPVENILTADEQKAIILYQNMLDIASKDRGSWFRAGEGLYNTFEFMRDMALAGMGGGFTSVAKMSFGQALKQVSKNLAKKAVEVAWKTPLVPGFHSNLSKNMTENYTIKNYGTSHKPQWFVGQNDSTGRILYETWAQQASEYFTEALGGALGSLGVMSRIAKSASKAGGIVGKSAKLYDKLHNTVLSNKVGKYIAGGLDKLGLHNFPMQFIEEIANVPLQSLMLGENMMGQLLDPRFYQEVAITTAALGGVGSAVNVMAGGAGAAIERSRSNKAIKDATEFISKAMDNSQDDVFKAVFNDLLSHLDAKDFYDENGEFTAQTIINDINNITALGKIDKQLLDKTQALVREKIAREGQTQALKAIMEDKVGKIEYGTSGDVIFAVGSNEERYFILDETDQAYIVNDVATGQSKMIPKNQVQAQAAVSIDDAVTNYFVNNAFSSVETLEDVQQAKEDAIAQTQANMQPLKRGDKAIYENQAVVIDDVFTDANGQTMAIIMDADNNPHTVPLADMTKADVVTGQDRYMLPDGRRATIYAYDTDGTVVLNILDDANNVIGQERFPLDEFGAFEKLSADKANIIEGNNPVVSQEQVNQQAEQVNDNTETLQKESQPDTQVNNTEQQQLPLDKDGNIDFDTLLETSPELFAQEYSKIVGAEETLNQLSEVAFELDKQIKQQSNAAKKQTSFNKKAQMFNKISVLKNRREALVSQIMKMSGSQIQTQDTQESQTDEKKIMSVSGGSMDINPEPSGKQNDTAPLQNTHLFDDKVNQTSSEEQTIVDAESLQSVRQQAKEYSKKYGVPVEVVENADDITHPLVKRAVSTGGLYGWYDIRTDRVYVYAPNIIKNPQEMEKTILHEVVAHKGLRSLLGEMGFNQLCDKVWDVMSREDKIRYVAYIKNISTNEVDLAAIQANLKDKRAAADEYMAHFAENGIEDPTIWQQIKQIFIDLLREFGVNIPLSDADVAYMLYRSNRALQKHATIGEEMMSNKEVESVEQQLSNPQTAAEKGFNQPLRRRFENTSNTLLRYKTSQGKNVNFTQLSLFDQAQQSEQDILLGKRLRPLQEGEFCHVERIFTKSKAFDFMGSNNIQSTDDVAYIFSQLEDESIENAFAVLVKEGKPYVIHAGMGTFDATMFNIGAIKAADNLINSDAIYMVHNHPSGNLNCSRADINMYQQFRRAFGDKVQDGIIINLKSGKYGTFTEIFTDEKDKVIPENEYPINVYSFNKQVFDYTYDPKQLKEIGNSFDVAQFISGHRLGDRTKVNMLILDKQNRIVGNIFTNHKSSNLAEKDKIELSNQIVDYTLKMGGVSAIVYGSGVDLSEGDAQKNIREISAQVKNFSGGSVSVLDWVYIGGRALEYQSAMDEGVMFRVKPFTEQQYQEFETRLNEAHQGKEPKLKVPESIAQKRSAVYHDFLRQITDDPYAVVTYDTFAEIMEDYGVDQDDIDEIQNAIHQGDFLPVGLYQDGVMYFFANNILSIDELRLSLAHERQHGITLANWDYYRDEILSREPGIEKLRANLNELTRGKQEWSKAPEDIVIGEFLSYAVQYAYEYDNLDTLAELGINEKLIDFIKQIDNEQRSNIDYSRARRQKDVRQAQQNNIRKDEADQSSRSAEMAQEGLRTSQGGQRATGAEQVNSSQNNIRFRSTPVFQSNAEKATLAVKQEKATPLQWIAMLKNNGGLKAGEDKWIGLTDWLNKQQGSVTKQQVLDYIRDNQIIVVDEFYGQDVDLKQGLIDMFGKEYERAFIIENGLVNILNRKLAVELYNKVASDKYGLIDNAFKLSWEDWGKLDSFLIDIDDELRKNIHPINPTRAEYTTEGLEDNKEVALIVPSIESWNVEDEVHFGDAGEGRAVAWARFGQTTDSDNNSVLVIDEIQSQRHQEGREMGYASSAVGLRAERIRGDQWDILRGDEVIGVVPAWGAQTPEQALERYIRENLIPDAPFEKNWHELAMKRMLRYAAENGFDKIAWTKGEQQADRYDIGSTVDNIESDDNVVEQFEDGTPVAKDITIWLKDGSQNRFSVDADSNIRGGIYGGHKLADVVGKELAVKLMQQGHVSVDGDGLRVGGEGMKAFYDKMLVDFMNKYGKKWGVRVEDVFLPELEGDGITMHSIQVTDQMKQSVLNESQVMFRSAVSPSDISSKGLRGTLGADGFKGMIDDIINTKPLLDKAADIKRGMTPQQIAARMLDEYLEGGSVGKGQDILFAIKDALTAQGGVIMPDDDELLYQLWRDLNPSSAVTIKEKLEDASKAADVRFKITSKDKAPATNEIKLSRSQLWQERLVDRMISVKVLYDQFNEIGIKISDDTDPYITENLAMSRVQTEDAQFKKQIYTPLIQKVIEIEKMFIQMGIAKDEQEAYKKVGDYLYARHAPERNKNICCQEVVEKMMHSIGQNSLELFKDSNVRASLMAYASRLYNEKSNPKTPLTSSSFAKNLLLAKGADAKQQAALAAFKKRFEDTILVEAQQQMDKIFSSEAGTNRSGMTDQQAKDIMSQLYLPQTQAALDELSTHVKKATHFTIDTWQKYSLVNDQTAANLKNMYNYYIPLRSWEEKEDVDYQQLATQAFNKASEIISLNRKASGRKSKADHPLAHIASLAQSAIVVGNKNMIRLNLYRLIKANQNNPRLVEYATLPKVYYVETPGSDTVIAYDERPAQELFDQGLVKTKSNKSYKWHKSSAEYDAHIVPVILNGTRQMIELRGEIGIKAASAINNTNVVHWQAANALKPITGWLSAVRTSYNPEFVLVNFIRDFGFATTVYPTEGGKDTQLIKNLSHAFKSIHKLTRGKSVGTKWDAYYQEFLQEGGQTGFFAMRNIDTIKKDIENLHKLLGGKGVNTQKVKAFGENVATYCNNMSESAMRLAVYITERENGASAKQAAYKAHEITVNFNRKGTWSGVFGGFYSFFNASIQGTARLFSWANANKKKAAVALATMALAKLSASLIAAAVAGDDYDQLSDYVKFSNIVIPIGEDDKGKTRFLCIPMPQGIRAVTNISDNIVEVLRGNKTIGQAMGTQLANTVGEFLPLSFDAIDLTGRNTAYSIATVFAPTAIQPWMDVWVNMDFKGDPIYKEPYIAAHEGKVPEYKNVYGNVNPLLVGTSKFLNNLAGGTDERSSSIKVTKEGDVKDSPLGYLLDINPAKVEHLLNAYLGGLMSFPSNVIKTGYVIFSQEEEFEYYNTPFINRFVKQPYYKDGYFSYYQIREMVQKIDFSIKAAKKMGDRKAAAAIETRNKKLLQAFDKYDVGVKQLQESLKKDDLSAEQRQDLQQRLDKLVESASEKLNEILKDEENPRD